MDHDFGTIISTTVNPREDTSSQDETNEQDKNKINDHNVVSSSSDNRKTISVFIDDDEYDTDLSTSFTSIKSPVESDFHESLASSSDHNYILGVQRPKSTNSNFPVIEGLNLDSIEDSTSTSFLPRTQQTLRSPSKRYAPYSCDAGGNTFYSGNSGYYGNQIKVPERPTQHKPQFGQQKLQYGLPNSQRRQQITESERLPLTLRQSGFSRTIPTNDSPHSIMSSDRGSVPPQRSFGNIRLDSSYMLDGSPAPIVTATRGRPPSGRNKTARAVQDMTHPIQSRNLGIDSSQNGYILPIQQQGKQLPEQRQQQRFHIQKRNVSSPLMGGRGDKQQTQRFDDQQQQFEDQQRHDIYLEEEEMLNRDFFAQQHQKYSQQQQSSDMEKSDGRRVRNDTITPSDPVQPVNTSPNLFDTSKPPDDPYLPPQQVAQYPGLGLQQQFQHHQRHYPHGFDASSIDGTINAVVRGDASVMQQHFGPPIGETLERKSNFQQHQFEPRQQVPNFEGPLQMSESTSMSYAPKQPQQQNVQTFPSNSSMIQQQRPTSSQTTFNHGLDELAQASSNLLEQSMSTHSDGIEDIYQQEPSLVSQPRHQKQSQSGQHQQTLHFKVVQTNHRDEPSSFPQHQNYMQQVFTVQQRQRPDDFAPKDFPRSEALHKFSPLASPVRQREARLGSSGGSGRRQRLSMEFSPVPIAPTSGLEAEEPELQQAGDFTKPMKWQRSFRKQTSDEAKAKKTSVVPVRASNANESLLKDKPKNTQVRGPYKRRSNVERDETQQQEGLDYITRCICGMKHNDPFMIQCDKCDVWQHGVCVNIKEDKVPDTYLCEQCQPRELELTPKQAKSIQVRNLIATKAPKQKKMNKSKSSSIKYRSKTPALSAALKFAGKIRRTKMLSGVISKRRELPRRKDGMRPQYKSFINVNSKEKKSVTKRQKQIQNESSSSLHNQYSSGVQSLMISLPPYVLGEIGLLRRLDHNPLARPMLVAPNIEGLVATPGKNSNIPLGMPIVEYTGTISLLNEVKNLNKMIGDKFTLIYSGLGDNNKVMIDATKSGSIARSVRRSCRSNATLQHAVINGQLRIYLYAAMNIDRSSEVTIPFDYDYRESKEPVECACNTLLGVSFIDHCPIYAFNKLLEDNANNKTISGKSTTAPPTLKKSPAFSPQRQAYSPRLTRNSLNSPITVKFENDTTPALEKQKSPLKIEHVIDEHKSPSVDSIGDPLSTTRPQRRTPRTSNSIGATTPKLELAKSPTPNDPKFISSAASTILESKVMPRKLLSSSSPAASSPKRTLVSPTRGSRSNTSTMLGKIKWGDKPPPNKRKESLNESSRSPSKKITITTRLSGTSPRLAASISKKPKKEENAEPNLVDDKHIMSREERKLQATIASIERAEHLSQEKKRKQIEKIHPPSEPPIVTKLKRKSFNAKASSVKSVQNESTNISCKKLFEELNKITKMKLGKLQEFKLPSDYDALRSEVMKEYQAKGEISPSKTEIHSKKTEKRSKSLRGSLGYATTSKASITREDQTKDEETSYNQKLVSPASDGCVWEKEQISECSSEPIKVASAPPTTIINTSDIEKTEKEGANMEVDTEVPIRPPNTKAHKKITLEEYKRKKKAEMEAKQQNTEDNATDKETLAIQEPSTSRPSSSTMFSASSVMATRHSPRRSFIPAISSLPSSPPQQLEDFAQSPPAIGVRHKQLFSAPSLDELKKRIHGESSFSSSAGSSMGEELGK
ncbi:unnamed protein product [Meloidogyne enterolobii]|uniref:Uncharacterized protein n=1 Tax=Meloidogyne enterolobii TaxID=390850 RepID=A0ACB0YH87_MELEN